MSDFRDAQKYAEGKQDGLLVGAGLERRRLYKSIINPLKSKNKELEARIDALEVQLENAEMDAIHGESI